MRTGVVAVGTCPAERGGRRRGAGGPADRFTRAWPAHAGKFPSLRIWRSSMQNATLTLLLKDRPRKTPRKKLVVVGRVDMVTVLT
jgi:hypothetical protein